MQNRKTAVITREIASLLRFIKVFPVSRGHTPDAMDLWIFKQKQLRQIYQMNIRTGRPQSIYKSYCLECGEDIYSRIKPLKFCAETGWNPCAQDYYNRQRRAERRRNRQDTACKYCGKLFTPKTAAARYCSAACKQKAYRQRHSKTEGGL